MSKILKRLWPTSRKVKIICAVLIVVAVVIIGFFILRISLNIKKPQPSPDAGNIAFKLRQDQIDRLNQDSDYDDLKDWEEFLYHTDPQKQDTDGDATPDGEEVRQGRDPSKPSTAKSPGKPDDYFATAEPLTDSNDKSAGFNKNLTADFTRTFLRGPLAQMLAGDQPDIDTKSVEQYADQLQKRSVLADAPRFTATDIKINPAIDDQTIVQYFNSVKEVFRILNLRGRNEMDVVAEALMNQDYSAIAEISSYPEAYQKSINRLIALNVPASHVDFHLTILNYLSKFKRSTEIFQTMETDPVLAILTINERLKLSDELGTYLVQSVQKIVVKQKK